VNTSIFSIRPWGALPLRRFTIGLLLSVFAVTAQAQSVGTFTAVLQPTQVVPPILTSNAFGNAHMTFDIATSILCYSISYTDAGAAQFASGETVAHFHLGAPGVSGGVIFDISPLPSPVGSPKQGCVGPLTAADRTNLIAGLWYINIHSNNHPAGEIRGQVYLERVVTP